MKRDITVGIDMGDRKHTFYIIDGAGETLESGKIENTMLALTKKFSELPPAVVAVEAGTHSAWVSRLLQSLGHNVLVGNPRKLRAIWHSDNKNDDRDSEMLARIARVDPKLLYPIKHRGKDAHSDLALIKAREMLVKSRSTLVVHCRGIIKSCGYRFSSCSAESFHKRIEKETPVELLAALKPFAHILDELTQQIRRYDKEIEKLSIEKYPETQNIRRIRGVGPITALAYVLTLEDPSRFEKSRAVGPFLGLTPKQDQSGEQEKQLGITKHGNAYLRRLLVSCANYILGQFGEDCDLRRFGMKLALRGGKNAKKRAAVAVARKLCVVMHHLWKTGDEYRPLMKQKAAA